MYIGGVTFLPRNCDTGLGTLNLASANPSSGAGTLVVAARREAIFKQSVVDEKGRGDALSKRFEEALKQAHKEPIERPARDFDLD